MSKKSRRRNKKILGALAAGLGAMALMRGRRNKAIDAGIASAEADKGSDMLPESKNWITKKNVTAPVVVADTTGSNYLGRMKGNDPNDPTGAIAQKTRGDYAREARINARNTAVGSPLIDNPYKAPVVRVHNRFNRKDGGRASHRSGGRVKGVGKAKRGFGRALKGGK